MAAFVESQPIIIDNGTGLIKVGFAGADEPTAVFHTVVGRRSPPVSLDIQGHEILIGGEALANRRNYSLRYPMERGVVTDWDDLRRIWDQANHDLGNEIDPKEHPVLLTEAPLNPKENRERMVEIMFEKYAVPGTYFAMPALLSLYYSGSITGIALDCGHGVCSTVPVYDGNILYEGILRSDIGGLDLNDALKKSLQQTGYKFTTTSKHEIVDDIKKKLCYVAIDYDQELKKTSSAVEEIYQLPDGQEITIGAERFMCPEVLFRPSFFGGTTEGIHQILQDSLMQCTVDIRRRLYSNIILSGGSMMFPGMADRIKKEITELAPNGTKIDVVPCDNQYSVWIGGSILASLSSFQKDWILKVHYEEVGTSVAHFH